MFGIGALLPSAVFGMRSLVFKILDGCEQSTSSGTRVQIQGLVGRVGKARRVQNVFE